MTAKEYLNQLRALDIKIKQRTAQLKELKASTEMLSGIDYSKDRVQSSPDDALCSAVSRCLDIEADIVRKKAEFEVMKNTIIGQIQGLDDARYIDILHRRYVERESWEQISDGMCCSYRHANRLHGWALRAFERKYKMSYYVL